MPRRHPSTDRASAVYLLVLSCPARGFPCRHQAQRRTRPPV